MITDIKEKLAEMQAKYIDKQSAEDTLKKVENRKTAKIKKKLVLRLNVAINFWPRKM